MTRKDYVKLAAALKSVEPNGEGITSEGDEYLTELNTRHSQWLRDIRAIAEVLQADNPRFDWSRFVTAAGVS